MTRLIGVDVECLSDNYSYRHGYSHWLDVPPGQYLGDALFSLVETARLKLVSELPSYVTGADHTWVFSLVYEDDKSVIVSGGKVDVSSWVAAMVPVSVLLTNCFHEPIRKILEPKNMEGV